MLPVTPRTIFFPSNIQKLFSMFHTRHGGRPLLPCHFFIPRNLMRVNTCLVLSGNSPFIIQP